MNVALMFVCPRCSAPQTMPCVYNTGGRILERPIPHGARRLLVSASTAFNTSNPTDLDASTLGAVDGATGRPANTSSACPLDVPHGGPPAVPAADSPSSLFSDGEGRGVRGSASRPSPYRECS